MADGPGRLIKLGLGLVDFLRDRFDELQDELLKRGEEREEDIRDFLDDLFENLPMFKPGKSPEADSGKSSADTGIEPEKLVQTDVAGFFSGLAENLGLATSEDILEARDRIDRLGRAIEYFDTQTS